jgi:dTDP-4-amino-4,6-dideoxygalactose transaminase
MDPVNLFVPTFRVEETLDEIRECLERGWTGLGFKTVEFEAAWKEYSGLADAHFLNSATAGLHLAIRMLKEENRWQDGDEIISTPLTFVSTNHAIAYERLKPVFADIDEYLCLDPRSIEERISAKSRAVMFVGIGGNSGRLMDVVSLCRRHGLKLILDASHMAGTRLNGKHVGTEADVAVFSFGAVKNLPTADSGMICFSDPGIAKEVRRWTWLGIDKDTFSRTVGRGSYKWYYDVVHEGFKYHGNSIMAAIGLVSLKYLDRDNSYRRQIARWYDELLADEPGIERVPIAPGCIPSRHLYQIQTACRDKAIVSLNNAGIYPGVHYRDNTLYKMYSHAHGTCPAAARASEHLISLPLHLKMTIHDARRVCRSLIEAVNGKKRRWTGHVKAAYPAAGEERDMASLVKAH